MDASPKKPADDPDKDNAPERLSEADAEVRRLDAEAESTLQAVSGASSNPGIDPEVDELREDIARDRMELASPASSRSPHAKLKAVLADRHELEQHLPEVLEEEHQEEEAKELHPKPYLEHHEHPHLNAEESRLFSQQAHRADEVHLEVEELKKIKEALSDNQHVQDEGLFPGGPAA